jgi:hypothetical protein
MTFSNDTCDLFFLCYAINLALAPGQYYLRNFPIFIKTLIKKVFIRKIYIHFLKKPLLLAQPSGIVSDESRETGKSLSFFSYQ